VSRDERVRDFCWVAQSGPVTQPTSLGLARFVFDRVLQVDSHGTYNPRQAYLPFVFTIDKTIPATHSYLAHDFEVADGVEVVVEGELLVL